MPKVQTQDGAEIFYETRGSGPVNLMLIHGWGGVGGLWYSVARNLDPHQFCSVLIDLRGHGRSAPPTGGGYGWDHFASDVMAVADHAGAETFIPVGSSLGGKLTLYLTAKFKARIPAQILIAPVGPGPSPFDLEERRQLARRAADWRQLKPAIKHWFGPAVNEQTIDACCRAVSRTPAAVLEATAEKLLATFLPEPFVRPDAPTLLIIGERDPIYGPDYQQRNVLPYLTNVETATLPSGHFPPLEHPAELAALMSSFAMRRGVA